MHALVQGIQIQLAGTLQVQRPMLVRILLQGFPVEGGGSNIERGQHVTADNFSIVDIRSIKAGLVIPVGIKRLDKRFGAGLRFRQNLEYQIGVKHRLFSLGIVFRDFLVLRGGGKHAEILHSFRKIGYPGNVIGYGIHDKLGALENSFLVFRIPEIREGAGNVSSGVIGERAGIAKNPIKIILECIYKLIYLLAHLAHILFFDRKIYNV